MTQRKLYIADLNTIEIFGAIGFDAKRRDGTVWRRVGTGRLNGSGSVDLKMVVFAQTAEKVQ